jgi:hypothetical protein
MKLTWLTAALAALGSQRADSIPEGSVQIVNPEV